MKNQFILTPFFLDEPINLESISLPDWQINRPALTEQTQQGRMSQIHQSLATAVSDALQSGQRPVSIAGACCTTIGVLAGLQQTGIAPTLIWFDAHGDFNTWETTPSGFLGGMPLAMLVGRGEQTMMTAAKTSPLPENKVILTDARDLDPGEEELVKESAVLHFPNVSQFLTTAFPQGPLYIHFDVDILNPIDAPAVNYQAPGGPLVDTLRQAFTALSNTKRIAAISISSWNPEMDEDGRSQTITMDLLAALYQ